jgi:hypothetical protein
MFGYLRETEKLTKGDLRRLRSAEAGWVSAIDAEIDRQSGGDDFSVMDDAAVARAKPAATKPNPNKPVAVKRSSGGGLPVKRSRPHKKR